MQSIFISHSSKEGRLAKYLASWLESRIPEVKCFCSSRPADLPPGANWLKGICDRAVDADLCFLLLSSDSVDNPWLHFEAGMVLGAGINKKAIPAIYGGMNPDGLPATLRHLQALLLHDEDSFNAFILAQLLTASSLSPKQDHSDFLEGMDSSILRLLKYGLFGLLADKSVNTEHLEPLCLDNSSDSLVLPAKNEKGKIVAVRASIIPRRIGGMNHWKFGVQLRGRDNIDRHTRLLQFHFSCHNGLGSFVVYYYPGDPRIYFPINVPAQLDTERLSKLELWLSPDGWFAGCLGVDSYGRRTILRNDRGEELWRLIKNSWVDIEISGWADDLPFQIDIQSLEIDRIEL